MENKRTQAALIEIPIDWGKSTTNQRRERKDMNTVESEIPLATQGFIKSSHL